MYPTSAAKLGSIVFSTGDWERLNKIAEKYHIPKDAFDKLYDVDRGDELDTAKINEIERERLSISVSSFLIFKDFNILKFKYLFLGQRRKTSKSTASDTKEIDPQRPFERRCGCLFEKVCREKNEERRERR